MTKSEIITRLIADGRAAELRDLLLGVSAYNVEIASAETAPDYPSLHVTRLVSAARSHLDFISRFGSGKTHVIDGQTHHFSYREKFAEWLVQDAPGVSFAELEALAKASNLSG
jgi:hypothetical protein